MASTRPRLENPDIDRQVGLAVRTLMAVHGRSQGELAEAVGMPRSSLNQRLNGTRQFRPAELVAIARVLGVPVGRLFEDPRELLGVSQSLEKCTEVPRVLTLNDGTLNGAWAA